MSMNVDWSVRLNGFWKKVVDRVHVVCEPAHEFADRLLVKEAEREVLHVLKKILPEMEQGVLGDIGHPSERCI
jgi:hypothetical protein